LAYASRTRPIRALLVLVATVSLFGLPYLVLLPIFADEILKAGPQGLGLLMGAAGVGAFLGALTIAARRGTTGLPNLVGASSAGFAVLLILFSFSKSLLLSTILIIPAGFTLMLQLPATNTLLQAMVPDEMRGRVMSFYSMCLIGVAPFGSLIAGWVASRIGAPLTIASGGLVSLAAGMMFLVKVSSLWGADFETPLASEPSSDTEITDSPF
ncbi:MAG TPA: MFS transporter, partial [Blastocatellia bacterium]|nr:MFS transporter [Blastocatellia bacterium]